MVPEQRDRKRWDPYKYQQKISRVGPKFEIYYEYKLVIQLHKLWVLLGYPSISDLIKYLILSNNSFVTCHHRDNFLFLFNLFSIISPRNFIADDREDCTTKQARSEKVTATKLPLNPFLDVISLITKTKPFRFTFHLYVSKYFILRYSFFNERSENLGICFCKYHISVYQYTALLAPRTNSAHSW